MQQAESFRERIAYIDELKGLAIMLVVLGHIAAAKKEVALVLYQFIYAFHMPLFIFLAGCTTVISYERKKGTALQYVKKRFVNLMIPYVVWAFTLPLLFDRPLYAIDWRNIVSRTFITNRMFWFLPTLYGLIVAYLCYYKMDAWLELRSRKFGGMFWSFLSDVISMGFVTVLLCVFMVTTKYQLFRDMVGFVIPFFAAVLYCNHEKIRKLVLTWWMAIVAVVIFAVFIVRFDFDNISIKTSLERMVLGLCATIILLQIFIKAYLPLKVKKVFAFWGKNTLLIYVLHEQILKVSGMLTVAFESRAVQLLWYVIVSVVICCICSVLAQVMQRIPIMRTVFLGKYKTNCAAGISGRQGMDCTEV